MIKLDTEQIEILLVTDGGAIPRKDKGFNSASAFKVCRIDRNVIPHNIDIIEVGEFNPNTTSQFGEIRAMEMGLGFIVNFLLEDEKYKGKTCNIKLVTDSMLYYMSLTSWIYGWMAKAKDGVLYNTKKEPVVNQEQIKAAFAYIKKIEKNHIISLLHLNSHIAKKNLKDLKKKFELFNKCSLTNDMFLTIYQQNAKCDETVKAWLNVPKIQ